MGTAPPARGWPRPATPVLWARRQEPWRRWRWGRLLAAGVTVVLVAALVPSARADGEGGDSTLGQVVPAGEESLAGFEPPAEESLAAAEPVERVAAPEVADTGSSGGGDPAASLLEQGGGGTPTRRLDAAPGGDAARQSPTPLAVADTPVDAQPGDQAQEQDREVVTGDPLAQAQPGLDDIQRQLDRAARGLAALEATEDAEAAGLAEEQHLEDTDDARAVAQPDAGQGCAAASGCPQGPGRPEDLIVAIRGEGGAPPPRSDQPRGRPRLLTNELLDYLNDEDLRMMEVDLQELEARREVRRAADRPFTPEQLERQERQLEADWARHARNIAAEQRRRAQLELIQPVWQRAVESGQQPSITEFTRELSAQGVTRTDVRVALDYLHAQPAVTREFEAREVGLRERLLPAPLARELDLEVEPVEQVLRDLRRSHPDAPSFSLRERLQSLLVERGVAGPGPVDEERAEQQGDLTPHQAHNLVQQILADQLVVADAVERRWWEQEVLGGKRVDAGELAAELGAAPFMVGLDLTQLRLDRREARLSQMNMVDPQVVLPPTGGHTGLTDEEQRALLQLPGHTGLTDKEQRRLQHRPGHPGLTDEQQRALLWLPGAPLAERELWELQHHGPPLTGEQPAAHTHLATAADGATSDQPTTTGWSTYLQAGLGAAVAGGLTAAALAVLAGCSGRGGGGSACYAVLAPVLSRLVPAWARPAPVYGPEHG